MWFIAVVKYLEISWISPSQVYRSAVPSALLTYPGSNQKTTPRDKNLGVVLFPHKRPGRDLNPQPLVTAFSFWRRVLYRLSYWPILVGQAHPGFVLRGMAQR